MARHTRWAMPPLSSWGKALSRCVGSTMPTISSSWTARTSAFLALIFSCACSALRSMSPTVVSGFNCDFALGRIAAICVVRIARSEPLLIVSRSWSR